MTAAGESPAGDARALVVARRTDQLGGRLGAIVNALSIAKLLDLRVRFVWPRGPEPAVADPRELFSASFLKSLEIAESELCGRTSLPHWELLAMSEAEAHVSVTDEPDLFVEVHAPFDVLAASWESPDVAAQRFRDCWNEIDWCDQVKQIVAACDALAEGRSIAAVHIRAGDIVDGDWRQVLAHEKYLPTTFVEHAISRLAGTGDVLVLSDNADYLAWLAERFPAVVLAPDLIPGYAELSEAQQALAEIWLLSRCDPIVGPPSSAFSRLAANLGPHRLVRADELAAPGSELQLLRLSIADRRELATGWWRPLVARDICWCLDVFADAIPLGEQQELAAAATELDPDFSGAAVRLARIAALTGGLPAAATASSNALRIAERVTSSADPLIDALATDVAVRCFAVVETPLPSAARARLLSALRIFDRWAREDAARTGLAVAEIARSAARCLELEPLWSDKERVGRDLGNLISTVQWLAAQPLPLRRGVARALAGARNGNAKAPGAGTTFAGLADHRSVAMYDPLGRDLDRMVRHLYEAVQVASAISNGKS